MQGGSLVEDTAPIGAQSIDPGGNLVVLPGRGEYDASGQGCVGRCLFYEGGLCMALRVQCWKGLPNMVCALAIAGVFLTVAGCSSHEPKPMAQPTPDQVRGHADHTFDKLKQEERERASQEPR